MNKRRIFATLVLFPIGCCIQGYALPDDWTVPDNWPVTWSEATPNHVDVRIDFSLADVRGGFHDDYQFHVQDSIPWILDGDWALDVWITPLSDIQPNILLPPFGSNRWDFSGYLRQLTTYPGGREAIRLDFTVDFGTSGQDMPTSIRFPTDSDSALYDYSIADDGLGWLRIHWWAESEAVPDSGTTVALLGLALAGLGALRRRLI